MASQSAFAAMMREGGGAGDLLLDISRLTGLVAFPFFTGLAVLATPMLGLIFGEKWLAAAPVLTVMALMGIYVSINRVQMSFCLAAGRAGAITLLAWAVVGLGAVLCWFTSPYGLVPVAAALVGAHYLLWPLYFRIVARIAGMSAAAFVACHAVPALCAGVMGIAVALSVRVLGAQGPVAVLAVAVPVGVAVFAALAILLMRDRFHLLFSYVSGPRLIPRPDP